MPCEQNRKTCQCSPDVRNECSAFINHVSNHNLSCTTICMILLLHLALLHLYCYLHDLVHIYQPETCTKQKHVCINMRLQHTLPKLTTMPVPDVTWMLETSFTCKKGHKDGISSNQQACRHNVVEGDTSPAMQDYCKALPTWICFLRTQSL